MLRNIILVSIAAITLAGCVEEGENFDKEATAICLDGVQYWIIDPHMREQAIAPRIDPETLTYVRCK